MTDVPSDADFERAKKLARERSRNLDSVCERVKERFKAHAPLYKVHILPQRDVDFRAYIFYRENGEIEMCEKNGVSQQIRDSIYAELERAGRGCRGEITVAFEFDSDENVEANFEGDYFLRLR